MDVLIALGGNLDFGAVPPQETLIQGLKDLENMGLFVVARSGFYQTPAFPAGAGPDYINAAALLRVEGNYSAPQLLAALAEVENMHGRQRVQRWGGRTLDIDLLAMEGRVSPNTEVFHHWADLPLNLQLQTTPSEVIVPHPRLHERAFVLVPLMDIASDWCHPIYGKTVRQMLAALPLGDLGSVIALAD